MLLDQRPREGNSKPLGNAVASCSNVEVCGLSASVEAEWMRDQEKCPKILTSRRRGGLLKHQNNSFFDLVLQASREYSNRPESTFG
jgi:hypothetical protein